MNKYFGQRKLVFQEQMEKKKMGRGGEVSGGGLWWRR